MSIYIGGFKLGKRADNKVKLNMYLDGDLKDTFRQVTEVNKTCMTDVIVQAIENYIKEHGQALEAK